MIISKLFDTPYQERTKSRKPRENDRPLQYINTDAAPLKYGPIPTGRIWPPDYNLDLDAPICIDNSYCPKVECNLQDTSGLQLH
ncbi:hypothetical protein CIPAW_03G274000 [Carya illinoinensis]|uniref:Uncharacterized protein n=1 Tax=Carya illinoinensis TaxID=32201 RepID=A0A8T1R9Z6_CARIL|nr:hypothetical protein CIPAW_03G274000 [Carya illinoinensis]